MSKLGSRKRSGGKATVLFRWASVDGNEWIPYDLERLALASTLNSLNVYLQSMGPMYWCWTFLEWLHLEKCKREFLIDDFAVERAPCSSLRHAGDTSSIFYYLYSTWFNIWCNLHTHPTPTLAFQLPILNVPQGMWISGFWWHRKEVWLLNLSRFCMRQVENRKQSRETEKLSELPLERSKLTQANW